MNRLLIVTTIPDTLCAFLLPFAHHFHAQGWVVDAMAYGISQSAECLETFDRVWEIEWSRNPLDLGVARQSSTTVGILLCFCEVGWMTVKFSS